MTEARGAAQITEAEATEERSVKPGKGLLLITVFGCGAAVMVVEIVGTRVIGPVFGVGLYVWAALLAVTLASLAIGYYAGGVVADRRPNATLLFQVVVMAGACLALAPLLRRPVLSLGEELGVRLGPLLSAALLFAAPLVALGMTAPIAVRLATKSVATAGRGIGVMYAASTCGSLLGTLCTAFILVPRLDAGSILGWTAALLIALGAIPLALGKRGLGLGLLLLPLFIGAGSRPVLPSGIVVVDEAQSLLGLVQVIADHNRGVRLLRSDHSIIGAAFERDDSPAFDFVNVLSAVRFFQPQAKTCLNIGLGTGAVPINLGRHGIKVDVVEIDPAVVRLTQQYFGYRPTGNVEIEDARAYLQRTTRRYDLVVHDTFTGGTTPEHLLSLEVLERIKRVLNPRGVLALNFVGYYAGPEARTSHAIARTLKAAFRHVRAYRDSPPDPTQPVGNIIFFASEHQLELSIPQDAKFESDDAARSARQFTSWPALAEVAAGDVITDAKNPLARWQMATAEKHFEAMNTLLPREVWLD
jgi:predicted membrane-bound spermidine synthase